MAGGDWSLPTKDSPYLNFPDEIKDRDIDAGTWLDDNGTQRTPTNIPVGLKRWNPTAQRFESWSGSAWGALSSLIEHKVRNSDQLNGQTESFYRNAGNINAGILALARGGLGVAISSPGADRILFWDQTAGGFTFLTAGSGLQISGTTLSIPQGAGSGLNADQLDGLHESSFVRSNANDTISGVHDHTGQVNFSPIATLTDGATISWDLNTQQVAQVTLGGDRTLANPTNMKSGGTYILIVKQDGTGSRDLGFQSAYKWPGGTAPTPTPAANAVDILTFISDGTSMFGVAEVDFQ